MDGTIRQFISGSTSQRQTKQFSVPFPNINYYAVECAFTFSGGTGYASGVQLINKSKSSCEVQVYTMDRTTVVNSQDWVILLSNRP